MMNKIFAVIIWIYIQCPIFVIVAYNPLRGYHGAPIIEPFDSVVINVNEGRTIECKGKEPVKWVSEIIDNFSSDINITSSAKHDAEDDSIIFPDDRNIYHTYLQLNTVTVGFVGFYYCVFERLLEGNTELDYNQAVIDYEASSIYVFINDPDNLLVEPEHPYVFGTQYEEFIIPCKPTSPNVKVELIKDGDEMHYLGTYDPKLGYTVSFSHIEDSGYYECRLQDDHDIFVQFDVKVSELTLSTYVPKPLIVSDSKNFAKNGYPLTMTCHVEMLSDNPYGIKFYLPNGELAQSNDFLTLSNLEHEHGNKRKSHMNLTINHALKERDQGDYKCSLAFIDKTENSNSVIFSITFVDSPFVEINSSNPSISIAKGKKVATFHFNYFAYPKATFEVYNPHHKLIAKEGDIMNRDKYNFIVKDEDMTFAIKFPEIEDFGNYTLVAYIEDEKFEKKIVLIVSEKPTCKMEDAYVMKGEEVHMKCECLAFPPAEIIWSFTSCQNLKLWPECREVNNFNTDEQNHNETQSFQEAEYIQSSEIKFTPSQPGTIKCRASNKMGQDKIEAKLQIVDLESPFVINGIDSEQNIAVGDEVNLECGAIVYNYTNNIQWLKNGDPVQNRSNLHIEDSHTKFSYRKTLKFDEVQQSDDGVYTCQVYDKQSELQTILTSLNVQSARPPLISTNFNQSTLSRAFGEALTLECLVSGLPLPKLVWNKDGEVFEVNENDTRILLINNDMTLAFTVLKPEDSGHYECIAENRIAKEVKGIEISVIAPSSQISKAIIISVASIIALLLLLSLYLCIKVQRKKKLIAELKAAGLANFEEGNLESIDPDINLDEQADLLPYDKKFEFPREKLKLGKQLGAGAFGVVVKALAEGIVHYEDETTVAVKMVKKQTDNEVMKALVSELKIMIHLGQHLNVVNLLGAVTKNIAKRELMVIVEYCQFGNLQSFLAKHRPYFIDQVRNDQINPMITRNEMRWSKNSAYNSDNSEGNHYTPNVGGHSPMGISNPGHHMTSQGYVRHSGFQQIDSCNTEATVMSTATDGEESALLTNNSDQPPWRSNYGMDYKGPARIVSTSDLVCWAFQVARGMEYLSSRKILHGDLAARNILLCDDNIVKICDFGLSKSMYKNDNYKRKGEAPLPFKWLSIEAISDHVFSVYSDIWSFGVVLWEFFTLGKVPYTGMEANQELFYKLRDGYRMEKPKYATQDIYDIMLNCWNAKPESRPLFKDLERKLSSFMMDSVKDHYLDLNEPYLQANIDNHQNGFHDYLTSLSIPEEEAPKPPLAEEESFYVNNSTPDFNAPSTLDYLSMSPKSGVVKYNSNKEYFRPDSPTITKNLDTSPKNKKIVNKKPELPEEIPMLLHNQNGLPSENDIDIEAQNSYTDMSFSPQNNNENDPEYKNLFSTNENYVNIPSTNKTPSIANPAYITFQSPKNHNY